MIYDQDQTPESRELIRRFRGLALSSRSSGWCSDYAPIERGDRPQPRSDGRGDPARLFAATLAPGTKAQVQILLDGSDSNTASIALGYAEGWCKATRCELRDDAR